MATVTIRHGLFRYYNPEKQIINGEEKEVLVERMAFHCETLDIPRAVDVERGTALGAFWTPDQAQAHYDALGVPVPWHGSVPELAQASEASPAAAGSDEEVEVELKDLPQQELVDWLMSTGQFDGNGKPSADEVVEAAQGDPELARRLEEAEKTASGDAPRKTVIQPLEKIQPE